MSIDYIHWAALNAARQGEKCFKAVRKPSLDMSSPAPLVYPDKQFIRQNALEMIHSHPSHYAQPALQYLTKPGYGKVPQYLKEAKSKLHREKVAKEEAERKQILLVISFGSLPARTNVAMQGRCL